MKTQNPLRSKQETGLEAKRWQRSPESPGASDVAQHYNKRQEVGREARELSPIIALKRFNNWAKSALINMNTPKSTESGLRVLDLGCGKGGDLRKWTHHKLSEMVLVDIAAVSVEQASARYAEGQFPWNARFFSGDAFRRPLDTVVPSSVLGPGFDVVTMQFCLHYGWESQESARMMLRNVATSLHSGGVLIATIPDDATLLARLHDANALEFGNDDYKVVFDERHEAGERPFGYRYLFWLKDAVDNVPEYVVDSAALEALASEFGLRLKYKARFDQILTDGYQRKDLRNLLDKMNVLDKNMATAGYVVPAMSPSLWDACSTYALN